MDEIHEICEREAKKDAISLVEQMQFEYDVLTGKVPMPRLRQIRIPLIFKKSLQLKSDPQ